jgi:hypothetical protein
MRWRRVNQQSGDPTIIDGVPLFAGGIVVVSVLPSVPYSMRTLRS